MAKETDILPAIIEPLGGSHAGQHTNVGNAVWLRVSAFLSLKSPNTQRTYLGIVNEWSEFLGAEPGTDKAAQLLISANDLHAISYKNWLSGQPGEMPRMKRSEVKFSDQRDLANDKTKPKKFKSKSQGLESTLSNATIYKKLVALRRIYRMLIGANLGITVNPFDPDKLPPPAKDAGRKRPTEMIDFELVNEIINSPDISTPKGLRDRALLATLFGGGLRRSEVINIRLGDIKSSANKTTFLYLRSTKSKKDANQALPAWASDAVSALKESRMKLGALEGDYLFISYRGRGGTQATPHPLSDNGLYRLFKQYCIKAGAGLNVTPHSARATSITKLLSDGIPHRLVQEFSRHSSIQMVELYDKRRVGVDENPGKGLSFK